MDAVEPCTTPRSSGVSSVQSLSCGTQQPRSSSTPLSEKKVIVIESDDESGAFEKDTWWRKRKLTEMCSSSQKQKRVSGSSAKHKKNSIGRSSKEQRKRLNMDRGEESRWSCESCTFLNLDVILSCEMCLTPRSKRLKDDTEMSELSRGSQMGSAGNNANDYEVGIIHVSENSDISLSSKDFSQSALADEQNSTIDSEVELMTDNALLSEDRLFSNEIVTEKSDFSNIRNCSITKKGAQKNCNLNDDSDSESLFEACCSYLSNADVSLEKLEKTIYPCEDVNSSEEVSEILSQTMPSFDETSTNELEIGTGGEQDDIAVPAQNMDDIASHSSDAIQVLNLDEVPVHNLDDIPVHSLLLFSCSQYTNRVYIYDKVCLCSVFVCA